jgi:hypothetical protein
MDESLHTELVAMAEADTAALTVFLATADTYRGSWTSTQTAASDTPWPYLLLEWQEPPPAPPPVQRVLDVVHHNIARLKEIVAAAGWPGRDLVGEDGADAAWLILQHAGSAVTTIGSAANHAFRRACIPLLTTAVRSGQAHPRHLAHVVDGVAWVAGEPPVYAVLSTSYSIIDGHPVFDAPVDLDAIDRRRAGIGVPPLAADVARRLRGESLAAAGAERAERWPDPTDGPVLSAPGATPLR